VILLTAKWYELDTSTVEGWEEAEKAYKAIRNSSDDDVINISRNTGIREAVIKRVKEHLFRKAHILDAGISGFDADPATVNAWRRMEEGTYTPKDLQLLEHEYFESRFEGIFKTDYRSAHDAANRSCRPSALDQPTTVEKIKSTLYDRE
jgi:hypothetical protein